MLLNFIVFCTFYILAILYFCITAINKTKQEMMIHYFVYFNSRVIRSDVSYACCT